MCAYCKTPWRLFKKFHRKISYGCTNLMYCARLLNCSPVSTRWHCSLHFFLSRSLSLSWIITCCQSVRHHLLQVKSKVRYIVLKNSKMCVYAAMHNVKLTGLRWGAQNNQNHMTSKRLRHGSVCVCGKWTHTRLRACKQRREVARGKSSGHVRLSVITWRKQMCLMFFTVNLHSNSVYLE